MRSFEDIDDFNKFLIIFFKNLQKRPGEIRVNSLTRSPLSLYVFSLIFFVNEHALEDETLDAEDPQMSGSLINALTRSPEHGASSRHPESILSHGRHPVVPWIVGHVHIAVEGGFGSERENLSVSQVETPQSEQFQHVVVVVLLRRLIFVSVHCAVRSIHWNKRGEVSYCVCLEKNKRDNF